MSNKARWGVGVGGEGSRYRDGVKVLGEEMEKEWDVDRGFPGCITHSPRYIKISNTFFQHSYMN